MSSASTMPGLRILQRPDHAGEHRGGHLQAGGVLVGRELARLLDGELRAVPIGVLRVAVEQHAEFVDAVDDLVLVEDVDASPATLPALPNISCSDSTASLQG